MSKHYEEWKVGDKIRRTKGISYIEKNMVKGRVYTVKEVIDDDIWLEEADSFWCTGCFEWVSEAKERNEI